VFRANTGQAGTEVSTKKVSFTCYSSMFLMTNLSSFLKKNQIYTQDYVAAMKHNIYHTPGYNNQQLHKSGHFVYKQLNQLSRKIV
jgi:hypothetical protein